MTVNIFAQYSCASPTGEMYEIGGPPGSYQYLQDNGYCNPDTYGTNPSVFWTFTPESSAVTINSGYSQSGCANIGFSSIQLYDENCNLVGTGTSFTGLDVTKEYTWTLTGSAWGGGPSCTGFDDFCPYYTNDAVLPIVLIDFTGTKKNEHNYIYWVTETEVNNDYFILDYSKDGYLFTTIDYIEGKGNSSTPTMYEYNHYITEGGYYRLTQVDYNYTSETFPMIYVEGKKNEHYPTKYYSILGQETKKNEHGFKIVKNNNGEYYKVSVVKGL